MFGGGVPENAEGEHDATRSFRQGGGNATSLFLAFSFTLCVGLSLITPRHLMGPALQMWLPGFVWLTAPGFVLGLVESYAYGDRLPGSRPA